MVFLLRHHRALQLFVFISFSIVVFRQSSVAQEAPFPVLTGLEDAVQFWKQVFTRLSAGEVVFFDPLDPGKIYSVSRLPDSDAARAFIDKEQARIVADYDLNEQDGRVRSQRGAKEQFFSGLQVSGRYLSQMQKIFRAEGLPPELAYLPGGVVVQCKGAVECRSHRHMAIHDRYGQEILTHQRRAGRAP